MSSLPYSLRRPFAAVALSLACVTVAQAVDAITFTRKYDAGTKVTYAQSMAVQLNVQVSANGQQLDQREQNVKQMMQGATTFETVTAEGRPSKAVLAFGQQCGAEMSMGGQSQQMPSPLAGKTVTVSMNNGDPKDLNFAGADGLDPDSLKAVTSLFRQDDSMMTDKPVKVGDSWDIPAAQLAGMAIPGMNPSISGKCTLAGVRVVNGRQVADVDVLITMKPNPNDAVGMEATLKGRGVMDVATSQGLDITITGPITAHGKDQGPQGPVDILVNGTMTMTIKSTLAGVNAPAPRPGPEPLPPQPPAAAADFSGVFADPKITFIYGDAVGGAIKMGEQLFPVTDVKINGNELAGTFTASGKPYPFTATLSGDSLVLKTGSTTYNLKRAAGPAPVKDDNPLDK